MKSELERLALAITKFELVDIGYPKATHHIRPQLQEMLAKQTATTLLIPEATDFLELFTKCDGIGLPDVGIGYKIYSLDQLVTINKMDTEPNMIDGQRIVLLGTDGGGGRFALSLENGKVYYLQMAGVSHDRKYLGQPLIIASSIAGLVEFLAIETENSCSESA